jgi:hypothetical protein
MDNNINKSKHQGIALVVALIAAASMLSLGAVAATSITPAYAGGDDGVKQKAEAEADCDQKNKAEDGSLNEQTNEMGACIAAAVNVNELIIVGGGGIMGGAPFAGSNSESPPEEFSAPSTP